MVRCSGVQPTMTDTSRTPEPEELLRLAITYFLGQTHTMMPARIVEYDAAEQKASVQPLLQRRVRGEDGQEFIESLPIIPDVPVAFPRSGSFFVSFPLQPGDSVMLIFSERSLDKWSQTTGTDEVDPDDFRMHDLTDAVAYPGLYPFGASLSDADPENLVIGVDSGGVQLHFSRDGKVELRVDGGADDVAVLGNKLEQWWNTSIKPWADSHVHPTGVGPSGPPTPSSPAFDSSILSTIFKLKSG